MIPMVYGYVCQDVTEPNQIPCNIITPVITCLNYTYNLTNLTTNTTFIIDHNMSAVGDGTYNITFNQGVGDYGIVLCDGSSATLTIGYEPGYDYYYIYIIGFVLIITFILIGYHFQSLVFSVMAGMLSGITAFAISQIGFPNFSTFILGTLSICFAGMGFWLILAPWMYEEYWTNG